MPDTLQDLQQRFSQAIVQIEEAIAKKSTQLATQDQLRKGTINQLDKNISTLATIIDHYEEV
jgi:hypothetical protein